MEDFLPVSVNKNEINDFESKISGYWSIIKYVSMKDLILKDDDGNQVAKLESRYADLRVWWDDGPKFYVATYAHSVTVLSASTELIKLQIKWFNQGGGVLMHDFASDFVLCNDSKRRSSYFFSTTEAMTDDIKRIEAVIENQPLWIKCT